MLVSVEKSVRGSTGSPRTDLCNRHFFRAFALGHQPAIVFSPMAENKQMSGKRIHLKLAGEIDREQVDCLSHIHGIEQDPRRKGPFSPVLANRHHP
jgi:hypothetical protein